MSMILVIQIRLITRRERIYKIKLFALETKLEHAVSILIARRIELTIRGLEIDIASVIR